MSQIGHTVAILGPVGTFSYRAAQLHFAGCQPLPVDSFDEILECVVHGECDFGLTPFDNSNSAGVIKSQVALVAHSRQIFVTGLYPFHVRLNLYSWAKELAQVRKVRSIDVVFRQAEAWLADNLSGADMEKTYPSTAAAVLSLTETENVEIAAVGGPEVASVPILARDIQTEPNITIFCRVEKEPPDWGAADFAMIAVTEFNETRFEELVDLAADHGCAVGANWIVDEWCRPIGVFEITKVTVAGRLHDLCGVLERRLAKTFLLGGYAGKSFTRLTIEKYGKS